MRSEKRQSQSGQTSTTSRCWITRSDARIDEYAEKLMEIRKGKIASIDDARQLLRDKIYFSVMMVKLDDADGMVAGAITHLR